MDTLAPMIGKGGGWPAWATVAVLYLPAALFLASHVWTRAPGQATGFVHYDMPYYMANAREYLDGGTDGIRYALPFSADHDNKPIHFQPQIAVLALAWWATGADPGLLFSLFGVLFGLLCIRSCLKVLQEYSGVHPPPFWLSLAFMWGGGVLVAAGLATGLWQGSPPGELLQGAFRFDPMGGWWFLNLGRNLVFPFEAYYHFLFFTMVLMLLRRRHRTAFVLAALLGISHPFTGTATVLMLITWAALERWYMRSAELPRWFLPALAGLMALLVLHYGIILPMDTEHRVLMDQWRLAWTLKAVNFIPAYLLVALLAFARLRRPPLALSFLRNPTQRLLLVWVAVWFTLENHEFAMEPHQPLHFTRGHTWSALFLIGAPMLATGWQALCLRLGNVRAWALAIPAAALLFGDNVAWFGSQVRANLLGVSQAFILQEDERILFNALSGPLEGRPLLVTSDARISYLAMVYTPLRSYRSHNFNTPHARQRTEALEAFYAGSITDPLLRGDLLVVVDRRSDHQRVPTEGAPLFSAGYFDVYRRAPLPR